ncbi:hypothetical protein B566_EDAN001106 [Ephemera danica]|nr:hypothetical protein B566_EDAN001106 [Ephemera danica]
MDDIELKNIQLQFPAARTLVRDDSNVAEERVLTEKGSILIAVQGDRRKPAILTYHDIGLNYIANFQAFFNYADMRALLENFCVYHVNAPGQEEGAPPLPEEPFRKLTQTTIPSTCDCLHYIYPTMEELADQLNVVMAHYNLKSIIGFGVGAGANILARFALLHPNKVHIFEVFTDLFGTRNMNIQSKTSNLHIDMRPWKWTYSSWVKYKKCLYLMGFPFDYGHLLYLI